MGFFKSGGMYLMVEPLGNLSMLVLFTSFTFRKPPKRGNWTKLLRKVNSADLKCKPLVKLRYLIRPDLLPENRSTSNARLL
jgi:hypothetical protein